MSEDLEDLIRAEFSARAEAPPAVYGGLADAAIGAAWRIRRRRRVTAAGSGLGLIVLGAAAVVWTPWTGYVADDGPPIASTTTDEAQAELDLEFVVQRDGQYGVVNTEDQYVPMTTEPPWSVERLEDAYLVSTPEAVELIALDGTAAVGFVELPVEYSTIVRSDAEGFSITHPTDDDFERDSYQLYPAELPREVEPINFELSYEVIVRDWTDDYVTVSADLIGLTGGDTGRWYLNDKDNYAWGLESVGAAGFEAAVITDYTDPDFVCVSDLEPGTRFAPAEQCGNFGDGVIDPLIADATGDENAAERVRSVAEERRALLQLQPQDEAGAVYEELELYNKDNQYFDPCGRWHVAYDLGEETWTLVEIVEGESAVSELEPPDGAMFPVVDYT